MRSNHSKRVLRYSPLGVWLITATITACTTSALGAELRQPGDDDKKSARAMQRGKRAHGGPGGPGGRSGHGGPPALWKKMSEQDRTRIQNFLEEHFPKMYLELERLQESHPERYARRIRRVVPDMWHMMEVLQSHPQRGQLMIQERRLDMDIWRVARRHRASDDVDKQSGLQAKMRELCEQVFDCRHRRRELQIQELETRIIELKQRHAQAAGLREKLIEQEVKERLDKPFPRRGMRDDPPHP